MRVLSNTTLLRGLARANTAAHCSCRYQPRPREHSSADKHATPLIAYMHVKLFRVFVRVIVVNPSAYDGRRYLQPPLHKRGKQAAATLTHELDSGHSVRSLHTHQRAFNEHSRAATATPVMTHRFHFWCGQHGHPRFQHEVESLQQGLTLRCQQIANSRRQLTKLALSCLQLGLSSSGGVSEQSLCHSVDLFERGLECFVRQGAEHTGLEVVDQSVAAVDTTPP